MLATDLIDILQSAVDDAGSDVEVRLAIQPHWPFEYSISKWGDMVPVVVDGETILYIPAGSQLRYLPLQAREVVGW
jgi:hypothetical protein